MIYLNNNESNFGCFTLTENTTIDLSGVSYSLVMYSKMLDTPTVIDLTGDTSFNTMRYNRFPLDLTGKNLNSGEYNYLVYQSVSGSTFQLSSSTINDIVESGLIKIQDTKSIIPVFSGQTSKFIFK